MALEPGSEENVPETPAVLPCEKPGKQPLLDGLWLPQDCGECEPCRARATCRNLAGVDIRRPW